MFLIFLGMQLEVFLTSNCISFIISTQIKKGHDRYETNFVKVR